jgi:hypothetical protein
MEHKLRQFAESEYLGAPLVDGLHVRVTKRLAAFVKSQALAAGVGDSTVMRCALYEWAASQGFDRAGP